MIKPNEGELRMALAEYLRRDESIDIVIRKEIREVVHYREETETRRPGCRTCEYDVVTVFVYYETWDGELALLEIDRKFADLISELEATVNEYGERSQYSNYYR